VKGDLAVCDMQRFPISMPIEWSNLCMEWIVKSILSNTLDLDNRIRKDLSLQKSEGGTELNMWFRRLHSKLDPQQPEQAEKLDNSYAYKIEHDNQAVYDDSVHYIALAKEQIDYRLFHG